MIPIEQSFEALVEDLVAALRGMSRANGYNYDYAGVVEDAHAALIDPDADRPRVFVMWTGPADQGVSGGETATSRFRRFERFAIEVDCMARDGRHGRMARRVERDVHAAVFEDRHRGAVRPMTLHSGTTAEYFSEAGKPQGVVLRMVITVRHDHRSGAMETVS